MREIRYKNFSLKTHKINWRIKRINVCQFELTFGCGLHCNYCYCDCYNKPRYLKKELTTGQVKSLLDKVRDYGIIWLCFTGGDPLTRKDFLEIYSYAKDKGFIITIFTNGFSMTREIADYLAKSPPFVIEITLNAITKNVYEQITQVRGSFKKAIEGIKMIKKRNIPLKIKTMVINENLGQMPKVKRFIRNLGIKFRPSPYIHARLNQELTPCDLRIKPEEVFSLDGRKKLRDEDCEKLTDGTGRRLYDKNPRPNTKLFRCAIGGGDGISIDPYGNIFPCSCIRKPKINLLKEEVKEAQKQILDWVWIQRSSSNGRCSSCSLRKMCFSCPGRAYLETGSLEKPVEWFCELAHLSTNIH
ncbi:MAG: radical SAM protein [Candidatus Omnitrophota bacterium]